jgi:two-component system, OmpR family, phosphate regulon sensor histidine kinase PhoR
VRSTLFRRSLSLLSLAALAAVAVFVVVALAVLGGAYSGANESSLARAASALAATYPSSAGAEDAALFARRAAEAGYRVTLIARDGTVIADSEAESATMENHASRPEVAAALSGRASSAHRKSATIGVELLYAAAPIPGVAGSAGAADAAALRLALREPGLERALLPARWTFALLALAFAAAVIGAAAAFSRMTARPLASLAVAARAYGAGEASQPSAAMRSVGEGDPEEIRLLAATLDSMAAELGRRMAAAEAQGRELGAILDAMAEAVIALDAELRITRANPAAESLFDFAAAEARGLLEATRSSGLQAAAADCLASGEGRRAELSLFVPGERFFQVLAAPLREASSAGAPAISGVVLLLNDITELRRLERVRRDFVANVSHELRTPVQMVKGFAETLSEGAVDDPERARRFVEIIGRNASRMESLIGDLLSLASLEREGRESLATESARIRPILEAAREAIGAKAEARGSEVELECEESLTAMVDSGLLEQALINLMDNAVKYSAPGSAVAASARAEGDTLLIEVKDRGIGIPARDLSRIFERFYRVDKARSRDLGGTGLGLAIVRHIAIAHGGEVSVESWEGEGSTFRIRIPLSRYTQPAKAGTSNPS